MRSLKHQLGYGDIGMEDLGPMKRKDWLVVALLASVVLGPPLIWGFFTLLEHLS